MWGEGMKNKISCSIPYLALLSVAMLASAAVSAFFDTTFFIIQGSISLAAALAAVVIYIFFRRYVQQSVKAAVKNISNNDTEFTDSVAFPVAVLSGENHVLWYNKAFKKLFCPGQNMLGLHIDESVFGKSVEDIVRAKGADVRYNGLKLTAYGVKSDAGTVLYFIDDTYYKDVEAEYKASRESVALIVFDNRELFVDEFEEESAQIAMRVEEVLQHWAAETNSLYRKLRSSRYMIIFQERDLKKIVEKKFDVLEKIHSISVNDIEATISVGIGRGEENLRKSLGSAKKALDMALGRGGDQVAIARGKDFEFFGGKSASVATNARVRTRVVADSFANAVSVCDRVVITGHKFSDLDCIGAAVGLQRVVSRSLGKKAVVAVNYESSMAKSLIDKYREDRGGEVFVTPEQAVSQMTSKTLLVVVDTQTQGMIEDVRLYEKAGAVIVIDHHRMQVDRISNAHVFFNESGASSASELCAGIIFNIDQDSIGKPEAEAMLSGIILDTKNFVINAGMATFEMAAYLRKKGADTVAIRQHFAESIENYKNKYQLISTAKVYKQCAVVMVEDDIPEVRLIAAKAADELLQIKGVNASFVLYRSESGTINISARSFGKRNVQVIMEHLGGGGHHAMAAAQLKEDSFEVSAKMLLEAIDARSV